MQFEKASQIYQIDIGNDGSAFIEVLVGRSAMRDDEYQVRHDLFRVRTDPRKPTKTLELQNLV